MPGLNMGIIKELEIPVPPMRLQEKFVAKISASRSAKHKLEAAADLDNTLFSSLQQRAFRGEL